MRYHENRMEMSARPAKSMVGKLILVALVGVGWFAWKQVSTVNVPLHYVLGATAPSVRRLEVLVLRPDGDVAHDSSYRYGAAPTDVYQTLRLKPGEYDLSIRVLYATGQTLERTVRTRLASDHPVEIDLSHLAPTISAPSGR